MFREMEGHGMTKILDDKGKLKEFAKWKEELGDLLPHSKMMLSVTDYSMLNPNIDNMTGVEMRMDTFVKKARALIDARYNQHNIKVQNLLDIQWPTKEDYNTWLEKFTD